MIEECDFDFDIPVAEDDTVELTVRVFKGDPQEWGIMTRDREVLVSALLSVINELKGKN